MLEIVEGARDRRGVFEVVGGKDLALDDRVVDLDLVEPDCLSAESISEVLRTEERITLNKEERRWESSKLPEQPTSSPTRWAPNSYTTSRDLTGCRDPGPACIKRE